MGILSPVSEEPPKYLSKRPSRQILRYTIASTFAVFVLFFVLFNSRVRQRAEIHYNNWFSNPPATSYELLQDVTPSLVVVPEPSVETVDCRTLKGAKDILFIMKTGATEAHKKLPVHLETTFKCTPNYLVFSDVAENVETIIVHDALERVEDYINKDSDEWRFYQQLNTMPDRNESTLAKLSTDEAWKLDKFKNIPMIRKSYTMYPGMKWYVTVDADTAIMWPTLLKWLAKFDHTKPYYMGSQAMVGDMEFAHGGSGYVLSNAAARIFDEEEGEQLDKHLRFAQDTCCGDLTIANALLDHNVPLTRSWPIIQGETPSTLDFGDSHWCFPTVSWHHVTSEQIRLIWDWQQKWLAKGVETIPRYSDAYEELVWPNITDERHGWDNLAQDDVIKTKDNKDDMSDHERFATETYEGCRETCLTTGDCYQYRWKKGECGLGKKLRLGSKQEGYRSGWNVPRIEKWKQDSKRANCTVHWIDPEHP
jgi:hypothetical protein